MIRPGLVSVSFRSLTPREVIELATNSGLEGIEWGGDHHVPHGNLRRAREVRSMTEDAGLVVVCYGSYYRAGLDSDPALVIETAVRLGAPMIRIWAGSKGSQAVDPAEFSTIVDDLRGFTLLAEQAGIAVTIEFHPDTLADTPGSTMRLWDEVGSNNLGINWQPDSRVGYEDRVASLKGVLPKLTNLHVFNWTRQGETTVRRPIAEAATEWLTFLEVAAGERFALLEFMPNDLPMELPTEAATLQEWLAAQPRSLLSQ